MERAHTSAKTKFPSLNLFSLLYPQTQKNEIKVSSAKTKFPSLNLFRLLYPQTQKNGIEVSLKYGIALTLQCVL